jgi:hypothetical protein
MVYRIKLTPATPSIVKFEGRDSFRIQITASDAENLPNEIFGHQRTLVDPDTSTTQDEFAFVCSPYDLSIYPANEPDPEQFPQYFRKATIDILVPGVEMAQEVITEVQEQVCHLITLLEKLDELEAGTPVWCPDAPDSSSSL